MAQGGNATEGVDRPGRRGRRRLASDTQVLIGVGSLLALLAIAVGVAVVLIVSLEDDVNPQVAPPRPVRTRRSTRPRSAPRGSRTTSAAFS